MKKRTSFFIIIVLVILTFIFGGKAFEKVFFNENFETVPDFKGKTFAEAKTLAEKKGFNIILAGEGYSDQDAGKIYQQAPLAGKSIKKGRAVRLLTSKGKSQIVVPQLRGLDLAAAKIFAEKNGISVKNIIYISGSFGDNKVIASDPSEGEYLGKNSSISLLVSTGSKNEQVFMPDIVGIDISKAKEILRSSNLLLGSIDYITDDSLENDIVLDSSPKAGEKLNAGTVVNITANKR